jgi:opacity protein-like surface antigen
MHNQSRRIMHRIALPLLRLHPALLVAFFLPAAASAQAFKEGTHAFSAGYGAGTFLNSLQRSFDPYTDLRYKGLGPLYAKYEYGVTDNIGMGLAFAYAENEWSYRYTATDENGAEASYSETTRRSTYSILARVNFHFGDSDRFDPYIGLGMGYRDANWDIRSESPSGNSGVTFKSFVPFGFEATIGARYFFLDNLGVYAEVGGAKSVFQGGLTARF